MCTKKYFIAKNGTSLSVAWVRDHRLDFLDVPLSKLLAVCSLDERGDANVVLFVLFCIVD